MVLVKSALKLHVVLEQEKRWSLKENILEIPSFIMLKENIKLIKSQSEKIGSSSMISNSEVVNDV